MRLSDRASTALHIVTWFVAVLLWALMFLHIMINDVSAQTRVEVGLANHGPLATEATHRVRSLSLPGSLTVGGSHRSGWFVAGVSATFTTLTVTRCSPTPCQSTSRDYRPQRTEPIEQQEEAIIVTPRVGAAWRGLEAGISAPLLQTAYSLVGPSPMLVWAPYASAAAGWRGIAAFVRFSVVPPQPARWVAFSEWSGAKENGQPFDDPLWLQFVEVGLRVGR